MSSINSSTNIDTPTIPLEPDTNQKTPKIKRPERFKFLKQSSVMVGGSVLVIMLFIALFAPFLTSYDPTVQNLDIRYAVPFWMEGTHPNHLLGTDHLGRDYLARLIYGTRISMGIGFLVVLCAAFIGISLGLLAGYFGKKVDMVISFIITTRLSLPIVIVALAAVALKGASITTLIVVLSVLVWDQFAIVTRSITQSMRNHEFIRAARATGASHLRIMLHEIVPNLKSALIVIATLEMANVILLESALSFLGLGVRPPTPSWGLMIAEGRDSILFDSWLIALPGSALCLLVLAINLFGDGLRDLTGTEIKR